MKNNASTVAALRGRASQRIRDISNTSPKVLPTLGMIKDMYCLIKELCVRMEKLQKELDKCQKITQITN